MSVSDRLARASALVVGAGGLGSPAAIALAASGVGRIGIVDDDAVERSNLARQILHRTQDVGRPKAESAGERLRTLAPGAEITTHLSRLCAANVIALVVAYDLIVDGSDNLATRLMVNDACVLERKPLVSGGILRFYGQLLTVMPGAGPCYRCLTGPAPLESRAPDCQQAGVLGAVAGFIGMLQAGEAVRILSGMAPAYASRFFSADLWEAKFETIPVEKDPECLVCGDAPVIRSVDAAWYQGGPAAREGAIASN